METLSYAQQRFERLQACIEDYLMDEKVSPTETYDDIIKCVDEWLAYHRNEMNKACHLKEMLMGHRTIEFDEEPVDKPNEYSYAAHITMSDIAKFHRGNSQ